MKIAVIGTGYVGLVTATCLAESGNDVIGVDRDEAKIATLRAHQLPIYEPGLQELVARNAREGRLVFTTDFAQAVRAARVVFVAVGTPSTPAGEADLSAVRDVIRACAGILREDPEAARGRVLVLKSTVPVGTNRAMAELFAAEGGPAGVGVVSNPEFLKEGAALDDFLKPDRVVAGVRDSRDAEILRELYAPFLRTEKPFLVMSPESAEMTKYAANAMLATKISFINEIANLCDRVGADIHDVRRGIGHDQRIGFAFLFPGPGYGGSCFPKDVRALTALARKLDQPMRLLEAVEDVNNRQKQLLAARIRHHFQGRLAHACIAIWGLAFKPQTDDIREAPALTLIEDLLAEGAALRVHDPEALANVRKIHGEKLTYCDRPYGAVEGVDALVIVTEWQEFRHPDFEVMRRLMRAPVVFDGRNLFHPDKMRDLGFTYYAMGRAAAAQARTS